MLGTSERMRNVWEAALNVLSSTSEKCRLRFASKWRGIKCCVKLSKFCSMFYTERKWMNGCRRTFQATNIEIASVSYHPNWDMIFDYRLKLNTILLSHSGNLVETVGWYINGWANRWVCPGVGKTDGRNWGQCFDNAFRSNWIFQKIHKFLVQWRNGEDNRMFY